MSEFSGADRAFMLRLQWGPLGGGGYYARNGPFLVRRSRRRVGGWLLTDVTTDPKTNTWHRTIREAQAHAQEVHTPRVRRKIFTPNFYREEVQS